MTIRGRGPAPKDPSFRARANKDPIPLKLVEAEPVEQPELVELLGPVNPTTGEPWSLATLALWAAFEDFPTTKGLIKAQWQVLALAMILHDLVVRGEVKHNAELRLQLAKFGVAPDDLMRHRVQIVQADEAEERRPVKRVTARERYGDLGTA